MAWVKSERSPRGHRGLPGLPADVQVVADMVEGTYYRNATSAMLSFSEYVEPSTGLVDHPETCFCPLPQLKFKTRLGPVLFRGSVPFQVSKGHQKERTTSLGGAIDTYAREFAEAVFLAGSVPGRLGAG